MRRWQVIIGSLLIFFGVIALVNAIWHIQLGRYLWPIIFIAAGVLLLVKPKLPGSWLWDWISVNHAVRKGEVFAREETRNGFIGDTTIELTEAELPVGEMHYTLKGFIGDITLRVPAEVGVKVRANNFMGEIDMFGDESTGIMAPVEAQTANYGNAVKKVVVDMNYFIGELKVRHYKTI
ncbi:MAG: hypothetical protein C0391_00385 [Anaerolinea sp.]|nr:hypothetical protein [Anaerolinea sp.]